MAQGDGEARKPKEMLAGAAGGGDEGEGEGGAYCGAKTPGNKNPIPDPAAGGKHKLPAPVTNPKKPKLSRDDEAFQGVSDMFKSSMEEQERARVAAERKEKAARISELSTSIFSIIKEDFQARADFEVEAGEDADSFDPLDLQHLDKDAIATILGSVSVAYKKVKALKALGELLQLIDK